MSTILSQTETLFSNSLFLGQKSFVSDAQIAQAMKLVEQLDFIEQNAKLISYYGQESSKVLETEALYKKWLVLHKVYSKELGIAPNKQLDDYWHFHILDTQKYMKDCDFIFGEYLHHYPYFGLRDTEDAKDLERAFQLTCELFMHHFGYDLTGTAHPCGASSCR